MKSGSHSMDVLDYITLHYIRKL